jgi:hypothetical protein
VALASLAAAVLTGLSARALPLSGVRVPLGPGGYGPATFVNASLPLPLESRGRAFRLSLHASANVSGTLLIRLGGVGVGSVLVSSRPPDRYALDVAAPRRGQRLDLALAFAPRPAAERGTAEEPVLRVDELEIDSPGGLALRPGPCLAAACVPIAALGFAWLLRRRPREGLAGVALLASLAALGAHAFPLHFARIAPPVLAASAAVVVVTWLAVAAQAEARASEGRAWAWTWAIGVAALPAVEVGILLHAFFRRGLLDHIPAVINDAIDYWLEARTFWFAGFQGGYFTIDERPARASFSHFGSHGPLFPMIHGTLGRLLGWHEYSIPLLHLALFAAALLFFARSISRNAHGAALVSLGLATFWPALLLLPTSLQEGLHLAAAVFLAGALRSPLDGRVTSGAMRGLSLAVLAIACLIRPSWGLLLPPVMVLMLGGASWRRRALTALAGVALWAALLLAFEYTAAPFGREGFFFVKAARLEEGTPALLARTAANARLFVQAGTALEIRSRILVLGLAVAAGALAWCARPRRELAFHACNLGSILGATLFTYVYGRWGDYRVFGPHLLLTLLLLATSPAAAARRLAIVALLAQLGSIGPFVAAFPGFGGSYTYDAARIDAFGAAARPALVFDARQDAWCNTLVSVNPPYFYPEMVALPPGLGVTMLFGSGEGPRPALRSRYVLLDPDDPRRWSLGMPTVTSLGADHVRVTVGSWLLLDLKPLASTPVGRLYENLDAHCPGG